MDKKYLVIALLWSQSQNRYIYPGEVLVLGDELAKILLEKLVVVKLEEPIHDSNN